MVFLRRQLLRQLVLAQIAKVVEPVSLKVGVGIADFGNCGLGEDFLGDIFHARIGDLVDEADIGVLTGGDARDDFAPGDFRIDDGLAPAAAIIDHHCEILHVFGQFSC